MTAMLLGKNFDYVDQAKIQLIFPMIFMPLFIWVPESPQHLMSVQKEKAANKAHKFFNGTDLEKMPVSQASDNSLEDNAELTLKDFSKFCLDSFIETTQFNEKFSFDFQQILGRANVFCWH